MFRKRHVQIGRGSLTMTRDDALLLYVKDRHVHEVLGSRASRTSDVHIIEERSLLWLEFYHRWTSMGTLPNGKPPYRAHPRRRARLPRKQQPIRRPRKVTRSRIYSAHY